MILLKRIGCLDIAVTKLLNWDSRSPFRIYLLEYRRQLYSTGTAIIWVKLGSNFDYKIR